MTSAMQRPDADMPQKLMAVDSTRLHYKPDSDMTVPSVTVITFGVALVVAAVWLVKRFGSGRETAAQRVPGRLTVRESVWVTPKLRVSHLQCAGRSMLLASSPQGLAWLDLGVATDQEVGSLGESGSSA